MQLSEHFSFQELTFSQEAVRHNIDNAPSDQVVANLRTTAAGLEAIITEAKASNRNAVLLRIQRRGAAQHFTRFRMRKA